MDNSLKLFLVILGSVYIFFILLNTATVIIGKFNKEKLDVDSFKPIITISIIYGFVGTLLFFMYLGVKLFNIQI